MVKISIIIPAYNAEATLKRCLDSVKDLSFDHSHLEIILVDNNSIDKTSEIAKKYANVNYVFEKKRGRSIARNRGASMARGQILVFIDSDVYLHRDWLKEIIVVFKDKTVGGAQGKIIPSDIMGKKSLNDFRERLIREGTNSTYNLLFINTDESPMINTAACAYVRAAFEQAGGFDEGLLRHEDIDFSKRVHLLGFKLMPTQNAIAFVCYNDGGWATYLLRSFSEGRLKVAYYKKWNSSMKNYQKGVETKNFRRNIFFFADEVILNLLRGIIKRDQYYLLKSLNSILKAAGQISGHVL